jgi:hypothetical protein
MKEANETECKGCVYFDKKYSKCNLRVCKGKTIISVEGWLKKVSKLDIPCNRCKFGKANGEGMECSKPGMNLIVDSYTKLELAAEKGCPECTKKSE